MAEGKENAGFGNRWPLFLAGCLVVGFAFYEWLLFSRWRVLSEWGSLGSALAPVAAVFSAIAVFAALQSIELQRQALAGQQREIDRHMKLLEEQREQFARSADAHAALADSQKRLADAQEVANRINSKMVEAQRLNASALLQVELVRSGFEIASKPATFGSAIVDPTRVDALARRNAIATTLALIEKENLERTKR